MKQNMGQSPETAPAAMRRAAPVLWCYRIGFPIFFLAALPAALTRLFRRGGYREKFWERFGCYSLDVQQRVQSAGSWEILHAVSVGEMLSAIELARAWKTCEPELRVLLTVTTTTGFAQARRAACDWMDVVYHPVDFPFAAQALLDLAKPRRVVFVEAAVWPELLYAAKRRGATCAIVNARMSPRSERRYRLAQAIVRPLFTLLDLVTAPNERIAAVWRDLGVLPERVCVAGNPKFDRPAVSQKECEPVREWLDTRGLANRRPAILGASTWPQEEEALARLLARARSMGFPNALLVLVPRHIERTGEIARSLTAMEYRIARKTAPSPQDATADVLLIDTTGELRLWYPLADAIFVGKSLFERGGQNPVEAVASAGGAVFSGQHMENFSDAAAALTSAGALTIVDEEEALTSAMFAALQHPPHPEELSRRSVAALAPHLGARERTVAALKELLASHGG